MCPYAINKAEELLTSIEFERTAVQSGIFLTVVMFRHHIEAVELFTQFNLFVLFLPVRGYVCIIVNVASK